MNDMVEQKKEKLLSDHIEMRSTSGAIKAVPIWQIKQWIAAKRFDLARKTGNEIGYDFVDYEAALKDLNEYAAWETAQAARRQAAQFEPRRADAGIADAMFKAGAGKSAQNPAFSPLPENVEKPGEKSAPAERPKPQDMI